MEVSQNRGGGAFCNIFHFAAFYNNSSVYAYLYIKRKTDYLARIYWRLIAGQIGFRDAGFPFRSEENRRNREETSRAKPRNPSGQAEKPLGPSREPSDVTKRVK